MKKFTMIKETLNFFGYGYTKEEVEKMTESEKKSVKTRKVITKIVGLGGLIVGSYAIGKKVEKRKLDKCVVGIYNAGQKDMYHLINDNKVPTGWRGEHTVIHKDLLDKGIVD